MMNYDVGIIGAGPAGLTAAFALQAAGQRVIIVEDYLWGGTCPNYGCDPKKILLAAVQAKEQVGWLQDSGLVGEPTIDWPQLMTHKMAYTDPVPARKIANLDEAGVTHKYGHAKFIDDTTVTLGSEQVTANKWIIATGTQPARLAVPGDEYLQDNEDFLNLPILPAEIAFIGTGFIAIEFANIAAAAGAKVHIIARQHRILREFDQELTQDIIDQMTARGIIFHWDFETAEVTKTVDNQLVITATNQETVIVEQAFVATGRIGNTAMLNLAAAKIAVIATEVQVNEYLQTTNPNVYAIGDVNNTNVAKLTPTASFEARYVAQHILGQISTPISYPAVPTMVYGSPQLGQVGLTADEAYRQGITVQAFDMTPWLAYWRAKEPVAKAKVMLNADGVIVGATVLSSHADELINYFMLAINHRYDKQALQQNIYAYPSLGSDLGFFF